MDKPKLSRAPRKGDLLLAQLKSAKPGRLTCERTAAPVQVGDVLASVFPESSAIVRRELETPLPDLYETINALQVKVGHLVDLTGLFPQCLDAFAGHVDALRADIKAIDKRLKALERKVAKRRNEHDRVKVLEGHLRPGDRCGNKSVIWLGKTWKEKFWANEDLPLGVVFASKEEWRWANVQYAYLDDPDDDE